MSLKKPKPELEIVVKKTYQILGQDLERARRNAGLTQQDFADRMIDIPGWEQPKISKREFPKILHTISEEAVKQLERIFQIHFIPPRY